MFLFNQPLHHKIHVRVRWRWGGGGGGVHLGLLSGAGAGAGEGAGRGVGADAFSTQGFDPLPTQRVAPLVLSRNPDLADQP